MLPKNPSAKKICSIEGCENIYLAKNLCGSHYRRMKTYGDPLGKPAPRVSKRKICEFPECGRFVAGLGLCNGHWLQRTKGKDLKPLGMRSLTVEQRFNQKVEKTESCWNWVGSKGSHGYGEMRINGNNNLAHRVSYERHIGSIPIGKEIDHICHNRSCVNPAHLRVTTTKQNAENHQGATRASSSGMRGVYPLKRATKPKWPAKVKHGSKTYYVGTFDSPEEAEVAVVAKRNALHTHNDMDRR